MNLLRPLRRTVSVTAVAVTFALAGVAAPVNAASAPVLQGATAPTPPAGSVHDVSCTPDYCFAATDGGIMASSDNGATWSSWVMSSLGVGGFLSVACTSGSTCLALTQNGKLLEASDDGWTYGAISLTSSLLPKGYSIWGTSCVNASTCYIEEGTLSKGVSRLLVSSGVNNGSTWQHPGSSWSLATFASGYAPSSGRVSCSSVACFTPAVSASGNSTAIFTAPLGSNAWTKVSLPSVGTLDLTAGVTCSASLCFALGNNYGSTFVDPSSNLFTSTNGGQTWVKSSGPHGSLTSDAVSCSSSSCSVLYEDPLDYTLTVSNTTDSGVTWGSTHFAGVSNANLVSLSCSAAGACWVSGGSQAGNGFGAALEYASDGVNYGSQTVLNGTSSISAVACTSANTCLYGGSDGNGNAQIVSTTDGAQTFTTATVPAQSGAVSRLACSEASHCVASTLTLHMTGGSAGVSFGAWRTSDGGATWHASDTSSLSSEALSEVTALTCVSSTRCFMGYLTASSSSSALHGHIAQSTDSGATWSDMAVPSTMAVVTSITCPTAVTCLAGGATKPGSALLATTFRLSTAGWTTTYVSKTPGAFGAASCFSATLCVASVGSTTKAGALYQSLNGGTTWTKAVSPSAAAAVTSVSCITSARCLAIASTTTSKGSSTAVWTTTNGTKWSVVPTTQISSSTLQSLSTVVGADASHFALIGSSPSGSPTLAFWRPLP